MGSLIQLAAPGSRRIPKVAAGREAGGEARFPGLATLGDLSNRGGGWADSAAVDMGRVAPRGEKPVRTA